MTESVSIKDNLTLYITKKTEKIVSAVFVLSDFFDDDEVLKSELRHRALHLLEHVSTLVGVSSSMNDQVSQTTLQSYTHLESLVAVVYRLGLISAMNYEILHNEIRLESTLTDIMQIGLRTP